MSDTERLVASSESVEARLSASQEAVTGAAVWTLRRLSEVSRVLLQQIVDWLSSGSVAKVKILHAGLTQAVSVVRNKAGKRVEFGLPYLLHRLGGAMCLGHC
jgi:hypothetical protein